MPFFMTTCKSQRKNCNRTGVRTSHLLIHSQRCYRPTHSQYRFASTHSRQLLHRHNRQRIHDKRFCNNTDEASRSKQQIRTYTSTKTDMCTICFVPTHLRRQISTNTFMTTDLPQYIHDNTTDLQYIHHRFAPNHSRQQIYQNIFAPVCSQQQMCPIHWR